MEKNLVIGEVIKPQGILGEIKVKPYTDDVSRFQSLKEVYVCGETYRVLNARIAQDAVYLSLSGVPDRNAAERLRGKFLEVKRENAAPLAEGRYYIVDVIGCRVYTAEGKDLGEIADVTSAHTDIYELRAGDAVYLFPAAEGVIEEIDVERKKIVVDEKRLREVCIKQD